MPGSRGAPGPKGGAESSTYCVWVPRWALVCHGERHRQTAAREPLCMLTHRLCSPPSEVSLPVALGQKPFVSVWPWLGFWGKRWERGPRAVAGALGGGQWGPQALDAVWTPPGARRGAVGPALSCPLSSLQGDRGFDGLAGLPGEKGHRVSVCCLGAAGSGRVRALRGSLRFPGGQTFDPRVVATRASWGWGRTWSERPGDASSAHGGPISPPPLTAKGPLGSVPQGARQRDVASAQGPPHCQETQQLPCGGRPKLSAPLKGQLRDAGRSRVASPVDGLPCVASPVDSGGVGAAAGLV